MPTPPGHRAALLESAIRLFRKQGYAATGLNEILKESGAPKGSLYHYFPHGKAQIGVMAVRAAGKKVAETLETLAIEADGPGSLLIRYCGALAGWMRQSDFHDGCPITTTLLETVPADDAIREAGETAFAAWAAIIAAKAESVGIPAHRAGPLSRLAVAAIEGALIQCRLARSEEPLRETAEELARMLDAAAG
ncbi:MAG: TetR/AcrR family transcriptional regulator [Alphaproteobacteria bacterium]|nr:TetR/AcrR family transcriptional regulator [Alphaproteobacteria bacterium]